MARNRSRSVGLRSHIHRLKYQEEAKMADLKFTPELEKFLKPLLERVDFSAPDLAARTCGCGCGCSGGGGGGGGGNAKLAQALLLPELELKG